MLRGETAFRLRCLAVASCVVVACGVLGVSAGAAEVRHYERVSPADKGSGDIIGEGLAIVAAKSGDGATFESRLVFGDALGSGNVGRTTYLARRGADGQWSTHGITPRSRPDAIQVLTSGTKVEVFSDDLSRALVWAYDLPALTDDAPDLNNFYIEDTATGALRTISHSQADPLTLIDFFNRTLWGASADLKHVGVVSATRMLSEAAPGVENAYKWDDGALSLVGLLPDDTVPSGGSTIAPVDTRATMSADGSRSIFLSGGQLYLHVDGGRSMLVSQPEGSDTNPASNVHFEGMTPDGKTVFFVTDSPLLTGPDGDNASGPDLYRFTETADPAGDSNLTLITTSGGALNDPPGYGAALVGMSDDGRRVYVHDSGGRLDVWEEGSGIRTVDPTVTRGGELPKHLSLTATPGNARVSADGEWLAYITQRPFDPIDRMYLYSLRDDRFTCVSCPSDASLIPTLTNSGRLDYDGFRPRFLSNDGTVFFSATADLVPQDSNGVADVYEYDGPSRTLTLLTSGKSRQPSMFADASASGDDVFFVTRQQLVASDTDDYVDLYDVRVGAAPPSQPSLVAPPCDGDACQGTLSGAPADDSLGSLSFEGDETSGPGARGAGLTVRRSVAFQGAAGLLGVKLKSAGRLRWSGRGLIADSVKRGSAGRVRLHLRLNHRARAGLRRSGRYVTTVHLRMFAPDGTKATGAVRVIFSAAARKGR
ncbi:MAG TPA: hypothetical protein VGO48_09165 [Conexibacter sp.]|jgi:hypothetical protein|nr:hypothetical protein [Conexibacter sp.]